ncbi:SPOR domain-containing protein [Azospirillum soli]|uniref:SPOR domain-containing protein n=1 Tax=Azospirillum soli TaxID=1304799 RepID=UPI001AE2E764|nr:SPOR domain-containing protein [Azospirillum soli]MBP2313894.1 hypothetical protein [Azospirillum soli]
MSYSFLYTAATLLGLSSQPLPTPPVLAPPSPTPPAVATARPAERGGVMPVVAPLPAQTPSGGFTAHVASYKTEAAAHTGWAQIRGQAPDLGSLDPHFLPVEVPDKGTWVRLTAGRFATRADAVGFCASLKAVVPYCRPLEVKE